MDKRKGYVLLLINAGVRSSVNERKKSRRLLHYVSINSFFNTLSVSRYNRPITVTRDPL
jgi:hypothetical protein